MGIEVWEATGSLLELYELCEFAFQQQSACCCLSLPEKRLYLFFVFPKQQDGQGKKILQDKMAERDIKRMYMTRLIFFGIDKETHTLEFIDEQMRALLFTSLKNWFYRYVYM